MKRYITDQYNNPEYWIEVSMPEWDNLPEMGREILMPNEQHGLLFVKKI